MAPCHLVDLKGDWPIIAQRPEVPPAGTATAANLAYIIYTSGSTGRPKGVQILHGALVNFLHAMRQQPGLAEQDVLVAVTTVSFDIAALELFLPLLAGARVVLAGRAAATDAALHEVLFNARATIMQATPTTWRLLVEAEDADRRGIDRLTALCGGEALPRTLADRLLECAASLWNLYGPTETTIWSTAARLASEDGPAPIGRPIANTLIYLLDADLEPVPIGVAGELYIGGAGLARGYLNRPDLTAARFIPNPFAEVSGIGYRVLGAEPSDTQYPTPDTRLYKTGDLGRYRHDGTMVYLGRRDGQVKLRGVRIELGEIAAALERHPMVRACAVVLRAGPARGAEPRLVAYVVPVQGIGVWKQGSGVPGFLNGDERGTTNDERRTIEDRGLKIEDSDAGVSESLSSILYPLSSDLREFLAARLPSSMIPADFVLLDALPRTPNGKLDRAALPAPAAPAVATAHAAPRTPAEAQLAQIWGAVLGLERVGIHDDFFALGGHSLRAAQVIARVRRECGVELPLRALFAHPTVALLARQLAQAQRAAAGTPLPPLRPMPRPPILPLSFAQQWLWLVEQLAPGSPQYNIPAALRLRGELDIDALARSLGTIIARHEALRTTFALVDGQPAQVIAPPARAGAAGLPLVDLQALEAPRRATVERELAEAEARRHFELGRAPLVRSALLRLGPCEHTLLLNVHHMIADGWSIGVFVRELAALYAAAVAGQPAALPDLPIQYADYTLWQREWLRGAGDHAQSTLQEQLAYWRAQLAGLPALNLPVDRPRPPVRTTNGATQELWLPGDLAGTLVALSRGQGVTLFMLLLAAWARLLADYSGQDDIAIGTPVAGRGQVETEDLIGFFANTLVLRLDLSGDPTFVELLGRVREVCLGAYAHQDLPFERLVAALAPEQDPSRTPLFQVSFGLNNATSQRLNLPGLTVDAEQLDTGTAKFDLALDVEERADGLAAIMQYSTDLFDAGTIGGMLDQFRALLQTIATEER